MSVRLSRSKAVDLGAPSRTLNVTKSTMLMTSSSEQRFGLVRVLLSVRDLRCSTL